MASKRHGQAPAPAKAVAPQNGAVVSANWSGPLPPPGALQQFNTIIPNGAERIMSMVEHEQAHRIAIETKAMQAEVSDAIMGKVLGALMTIAAIVGAVYTAYIGAHWTVSVAIVSVPITALIGKFVRARP
jgi:uncharacterized membrane protein